MNSTDKHRNPQGAESVPEGQGAADKRRTTDRETASKQADAGAAPEQSERKPDERVPGEDDDIVDPSEKRQDPPVPGQPKKIRVDQ